MFGGVGAAHATTAVTHTSNTVLLSTGDVLANEGLSASPVGSAFGPFSPSSQKIYLFLTGAGHTFKDQGGFAFAMNTPTSIGFINVNGVTVLMYLYESTNFLSTPFTVTVST